MKRSASPTLIGAFVLGAGVLGLGALYLLGSQRWFEDTSRYVTYFSSSKQGLEVGAPVTLDGVNIGMVSEIGLYYARGAGTVRVPVYLSLNLSTIAIEGESFPSSRAKLQAMVADGLRAQLQEKSFVTGQQHVALVFHDDLAGRLASNGDGAPEIPTAPTESLLSIARSLQELPLERSLQQLTATLAAVETLVGGDATEAALRDLHVALQEIRTLASVLRGRLPDTLTRLDGAVAGLDGTAERIATLVEDLGERLDPVMDDVATAAESLGNTSWAARQAAEQAEAAFAGADEMFSRQAPFRYHMNESLEAVTAAARSLRGLTDYLQRNPSALIQGRVGER